MGARRLPASRRHGTHDGIASSCTDARAACACPLPRARPVSLSRPKCWQHGVVRHVEPSWDQGARAESARDGRSRPRMGTAVARARGGPPASPGSEASRGSICVSREKKPSVNTVYMIGFFYLRTGRSKRASSGGRTLSHLACLRTRTPWLDPHARASGPAGDRMLGCWAAQAGLDYR